MRPSTPLPDALGDAFRVRDALEVGVGAGRLRGRDLVAPFRGIRAAPVTDVAALAASYAARMPSHQAFAGRTAARLWGLPLASAWTTDEPIVIARPYGTFRSRVRGTRELALKRGSLATREIDGLRALTPESTALTLARELSLEHLVQVVDALLTPAKRYPELRLPREAGRAYMTRAQLDGFLERCTGMSGIAALRAAALDARVGAESRFETITRLLIVEAGLPEPVVHPLVIVDGIELHPDLGYPELKIAIEYEGEEHRQPGRWEEDIDRYARLEAAGWIIVRITKADLPRRGARLVERVARARARRA